MFILLMMTVAMVMIGDDGPCALVLVSVMTAVASTLLTIPHTRLYMYIQIHIWGSFLILRISEQFSVACQRNEFDRN